MQFRRINDIRAYDLESLYGDIGGYMGLLLGYSILSFPGMILFCYEATKKRIVDLKQRNSNEENHGIKESHSLTMLVAATIPTGTLVDENLKERLERQHTKDTKYDMILMELHKRLKSVEEQLKKH